MNFLEFVQGNQSSVSPDAGSTDIPRNIHYVYAVSVEPPQYSVYTEKVRRLHPQWEITIWDDVVALSLVAEYFPELKEMYTSYKFPVQRADVFRVMLMYLKGGFYMDLDILCFKKLDEICGRGVVLGVEKVLTQRQCASLGHKHRLRIANYMFGSSPRHQFWLDILKGIEERSRNPVHSESDVLESTGPGVVTDVYHAVRDRYPDILVLPNDEKPCLKACGPASCHFGDYAAHLHHGGWRWENSPPL
jgi:inositol phosphorylceramide mannosyltransferase catalytic subunit